MSVKGGSVCVRRQAVVFGLQVTPSVQGRWLTREKNLPNRGICPRRSFRTQRTQQISEIPELAKLFGDLNEPRSMLLFRSNAVPRCRFLKWTAPNCREQLNSLDSHGSYYISIFGFPVRDSFPVQFDARGNLRQAAEPRPETTASRTISSHHDRYHKHISKKPFWVPIASVSKIFTHI